MTRFKSLITSQSKTPQQVSLEILSWPATYSTSGFSNLCTEQWGLATEGEIEKPTRFLYRNIQALPQTALERRWIHADGWSVKAKWQGVLLDELVKRIKPNALEQPLWVHQENVRGEQECMLLQDLLDGQAMLCYQVDGQPLDSLYGGPVALMVFDRYSYKGLGQITRLFFANKPLNKTAHLDKGYSFDGDITPGDYYAFDLQAFRPLHGAERILAPET